MKTIALSPLFPTFQKHSRQVKLEKRPMCNYLVLDHHFHVPLPCQYLHCGESHFACDYSLSSGRSQRCGCCLHCRHCRHCSCHLREEKRTQETEQEKTALEKKTRLGTKRYETMGENKFLGYNLEVIYFYCLNAPHKQVLQVICKSWSLLKD